VTSVALLPESWIWNEALLAGSPLFFSMIDGDAEVIVRVGRVSLSSIAISALPQQF
jgi:hypothetical protein